MSKHAHANVSENTMKLPSPLRAAATVLLLFAVSSPAPASASEDLVSHAVVSQVMRGDPAGALPPQTTASVTALVPASQSALATTAVSSGALAALGSGGGAIAVLGAGATGLSIYAGVQNSIWLYKKITMALAKPSAPPTSIDRSGHSADDQPKSPERLYLVTFVSQPKVYKGFQTGPLDFVVIRAETFWHAAFYKAPLAVSAYMMRNYAEAGETDIFTEANALLSNAIAGITSVHDIGPAAGVTPQSDIRVSVAIEEVQVSSIKSCDGRSWNAYVTGEVDPRPMIGLGDSRVMSLAWRRSVVATHFPPPECTRDYGEALGDIHAARLKTYQTSIDNNYTGF